MIRFGFQQSWVAVILFGLAMAAAAQNVYRVVGADGKLTYSDTPPSSSTPVKMATSSAGATGASSAASGLPYALQQTASRFPVTLYSASDCDLCNAARNLLRQRGIPFVEKTIISAEDQNALIRLAGEASVPVLMVGGQRIKGYAEQEWMQMLDIAGYPATSQLPASYRAPSPTPLAGLPKPAAAIAAQTAPVPAQPAPVAAPGTPALPSGGGAPSATNPAGIRF